MSIEVLNVHGEAHHIQKDALHVDHRDPRASLPPGTSHEGRVEHLSALFSMLMDQETMNVAIAGQPGNPGGCYYMDMFGSMVTGSANDDAAVGNGRMSAEDASGTNFYEISRQKKGFPDDTSYVSHGTIGNEPGGDNETQGKRDSKHETIKGTVQESKVVTKKHRTTKGQPNHDLVSNKSDVFVSKNVFKRLSTQYGDTGKKIVRKSKSRSIQSTMSRDKIAKSESKGAQQENATKSIAKKLGTSTLRRLMMSPSQTSSEQSKQVTVYKVAVDDNDVSKSTFTNKADNNNRIFEREGTGFFSKGLSIPSFHSMSHVTSFRKPSLIQSSEALCGVCSLKNCKSSVCKGLKGIMETNKKEFTLKRADSSDDSGCFSNLSRQSTNLQSTSMSLIPENEGKAVCYDCDENEIESFDRSGQLSRAVGMCTVCGNEAQRHAEGLCKNCWNRLQKEGVLDTLDDFTSYAHSLASSVKNILTISPNESGSQKEDQEKIVEDIKHNFLRAAEDVHTKSNPDAVLHRFKSEIPILHSENSRNQGSLNRSVSLDITFSPSNSNVKSPSTGPGEKPGINDSNSLLSLDDGKQTRTNQQDKLATVGEESSEKEKIWMTSDDDRSIRSDREERTKRKVVRGKSVVNLEREKTKINPSSSDLTKYFNPTTGRYEDQSKNPVPNPRKSKFLSRADRAKTDGDFFAREGSTKKTETKKVEDPPKPPMKAARTTLVPRATVNRPSKQEKENVNQVKVSRLQVLSEGTPVDPPNGIAGKRSRTSLQRSATAPYKNIPKDLLKERVEKLDRPSSSGSFLKATKSVTRLTMRTNKASALRKENSMKDRERINVSSNPPSVVLKEDGTKSSPKPFPRRRSTSHDESESSQFYNRLTDVQMSRSRSASGEDDDQGKSVKGSCGCKYSPVPARRSKFKENSSALATDGYMGTAAKEFVNNDFIMDQSARNDLNSYDKTSFIDKDVLYEGPRTNVALNQEGMENNASYYDGSKSHGTHSEEHLPPIPEKAAVLHHQEDSHKDTECYFDDVDAFAADNSLVGAKNAQHFMSAVKRDASFHDDIDGYTVSLRTTAEDSSQWYTTPDKPFNGERPLGRRDRSHESKSSTSFHNVMAVVKSSHSDVELRRPPLDNPCRKSSIYSESDVDTGVIYHVAKRMTTRAHVPPYHDIATGAYKGLFTGDVSTSDSSNSGFSNKSEASDVYTGGFFKSDPFYDNDNGQSSSESSCSQVYFEPDGNTTKKEPSLDDIYTGGIFSTSQNALALNNNHSGSYDILKNGSSNNSTRPPVHRMSRRSRCRPRIDVIMERGLETGRKFFEEPAMYLRQIEVTNCSNNSNNWLDNFDFQNMKEQEPLCPTVVQNDEPVYTDYDLGTQTVTGHDKMGTASGSGFDFSKYGIQETANTGFFFSSPKESKGNDDVWYQSSCDPNQCYEGGHASEEKFPQSFPQRSWKEDAKSAKNNHNNCNNSSLTLNLNNNHNLFEDFYTGEYKGNPSPPVVHNPPNPRTSSSGDLYETVPPKYASSGFQDQSYTSGGMHDVPQERQSPLHHENPDRQSPGGFYEQTNLGYAGYGLYDSSSGRNSPWDSYGQTDGRMPSPMSSRYDDRKARIVPEERNSYFDYTSSRSPERAGFMSDDDLGYTFDPNEVEKKIPPKPAVNEIRKVGSIVCRDDVANKDDYAENVNRDLLDEPGAWVPFAYMHDEEKRHPAEMGGSRSAKRDFFGAAETSGGGSLAGGNEESHYAHNRFYDSIGTRTNWREMNQSRSSGRDSDGDNTKRGDTKERLRRKTSPQSIGDHNTKKTSSTRSMDKPAKKIDDYPNRAIWRPQDVIPERARGNKSIGSGPKSHPSPTLQDPSDINGNSAGNPAREEKKHLSPPRPKPAHIGQTEIPKWRKVVIEYPKLRPKKPKVQLPQADPPTYMSSVILQDEMIFISTKKVKEGEGNQEDERGEPLPLQPMKNPFQPIQMVIERTILDEKVDNLLNEKRPKLVPTSCIPTAQLVLFDTSPTYSTFIAERTSKDDEKEDREIMKESEKQPMASGKGMSSTETGKQIVATKPVQHKSPGMTSNAEVTPLVKTTLDESEREKYLLLYKQLVGNEKTVPVPLRKREKRLWRLPEKGAHVEDNSELSTDRTIDSHVRDLRSSITGARIFRASADIEKITSQIAKTPEKDTDIQGIIPARSSTGGAGIPRTSTDFGKNTGQIAKTPENDTDIQESD